VLHCEDSNAVAPRSETSTEIAAHVAGTVWKIDAKVGDTVPMMREPMTMVAVALIALAGCNRDAVGSGDSCTRSSECEKGLACVEGKCSSNLNGIANAGTVPMLMMEMPAEMQADQGGSAAGSGASGTGGSGMAMGGAGAQMSGPPDASVADAQARDSGP
jgi:hypothetical protein